MHLDDFFLSSSSSLPLLSGRYDLPLVALSLFVAILAGIMAFQLANMARSDKGHLNRQTYLASGAFVLGSGVWSMHFIGMLAFSVCSTASYDKGITVLSMLPSFLASWVALLLIAKERVTRWQLVISGVLVGAGIGVMHYSGMAAVHKSLMLRFDPLIFAVSIVVAVVLSISALWLRFELTARQTWSSRRIDILSGTVVGIAISGMHYTGMKATHFLVNPNSTQEAVENVDLAISIAGITTLAILVTGAGNALLRYRSIYRRMVQTEARTRTIVETAVDGIITIDSLGIIRDFNSAAERMFGWQAKEVLGQNIRVLMPEPQRGQHDGYIQDYLRTGQAKIIGSGRELIGLRKDRSTFPLRLGLGEASLQNETLFVGFITDLTDSKRRNAEFEGVVNAIGRSLAVIEFDLFGTILDANANFLKMTGYTLDELQGRHHSILCEPGIDTNKSYLDFWENLRRGIYTSGEFKRYGKQGQEIWIHGSYNPIFDPEGRPYKIIKFASDLSERHAMEQDLREAKAKAEYAAAAKNTFLANMSHEIRTPMNAILGFTDVLLNDPVTDTQRRHLTTVRNSARSLLSLLNDILDTAKLERGAVELEIADFSLREVCMHVLASLRVNAQHKNLPLILDYANDTAEFFKGDALRIQQILINLVGNAIKFTERGQVRLEVEFDGKLVRLCVVDTGIGIAPDRIDHIFNPFAQADASMSRRFGGTGLGTSISKQLIELMHGRIWVESELGQGSRFYVELPLSLGHQVSVVTETPLLRLPPLKILAADDVPQNLELLQLLLQRDAHQLLTVANGQEAYKAATRQSFDIILMDVQMPVMNGLEASHAIRQHEQEQQTKRTPIIALSASVLQEDVQAALDAGMDGFVHKPVELAKLNLEIARLLNLDIELPAVSPEAIPNSTLVGSVLQGSVIDWNKGRQLWGSEQRYQQALRQFQQEFGDSAQQLRDIINLIELNAHRKSELGAGRLQEYNAVDEKHGYSELAALLHKLKGAAANLALPRITQLLGQMELGALNTDPNSAAMDPQWQTQINQVADEFNHLAESLAVIDTAAQGSALQGAHTDKAVDPEISRRHLQELDQSLRHGEFNEAALNALQNHLSATDFAKLDHLVNAFDFDAARALIAEFSK
ncbi:PAS domain S-box protein [Undibacterium cyanobacteriorum]|uniref:histidine kinase n=1 Tax=Undibacterium cyanobacteriorum TaxID=3073561 RepID=A0ABY9RKX0_9BURK|nr:PAS domain S-box protein [Undibacterium sp. 20NA77.5]WMW81330.1 PAS domain S-box protein [Undibacterium sp. 20NA77.5]